MYHLGEIRGLTGDKPKSKPKPKKKEVDLTPINLQTVYANNALYGGNRYMDTTALRRLDNYMIGRNVGYPQRVAMMTNYHQEGNTAGDHGNGAYGIMGWRGDRATPIINTDEQAQFEYLYNTAFGAFNPSHWHHGGKGSGYQKALDAQRAFLDAQTVEDATRAYTYGYVRPGPADRKFRLRNVTGLITPR